MKFKLFDLGKIEFKQAWQLQKWIFQEIKSGVLDAALLVCRHDPVITLGRLAAKTSVLVPRDELEKRGIPVYAIERGGDATYHGPGQITAYPIFNLSYFRKDVHFFLRQLEEVVIALNNDLRIKSFRRPGFTGVWTDAGKIASVGIAVKNWITFHGVSLNIKAEDLENFLLIRPCGMNIPMASLETVTAKRFEFDEVKESLVGQFRSVFRL
ncbi:MAG TPA: lipoyl(octanoyl) transferase LipB [Patescibacteria group bacterium]|nr:lipoyl(octanoyl) transferase LipB [Patescibacteria group bacterium]